MSRVTGEADPVIKGPGDDLVSGSVLVVTESCRQRRLVRQFYQADGAAYKTADAKSTVNDQSNYQILTHDYSTRCWTVHFTMMRWTGPSSGRWPRWSGWFRRTGAARRLQRWGVHCRPAQVLVRELPPMHWRVDIVPRQTGTILVAS